MVTDYISRDAAIKIVKTPNYNIHDMLFALKTIPGTLSPERSVGEWIEDRMDYRCSACGKTVKDEIFYMFYPYQLPAYCPNCGTRMIERKETT